MKRHNLQPGDFVRARQPNEYYALEDWGIKPGDILLVVEDKQPDKTHDETQHPNWVLLASPLDLHKLFDQNGHRNVIWLDADWLEKVEDYAL